MWTVLEYFQKLFPASRLLSVLSSVGWSTICSQNNLVAFKRWRSSSEIQNKRKSKTCSAHCAHCAHLKCPSGCRICASDETDWPFGCICFPKWGSFCFAFQSRVSLGQADSFWRIWTGASRCRRRSWEWSHWSHWSNVYHQKAPTSTNKSQLLPKGLSFREAVKNYLADFFR